MLQAVLLMEKKCLTEIIREDRMCAAEALKSIYDRASSSIALSQERLVV
jgi:hypothetical protein